MIALAVLRVDDRLLVFEGFDPTDGTWFYRPLGGAVEPGERAACAVVREIREELGEDIVDVEQIGVLENLFVLDGRPGHEVVFVFSARFADPTVYARDRLVGVEDDGQPMTVVWRHLDGFDARHRLVPEPLMALLRAR